LAEQLHGGEDDPALRLGHASPKSRATCFVNDLVNVMARDATDVWIEQQPAVSDRRALRRWLDEMPEVGAQTPPSVDDGLIYKTTEQPPPVANEIDDPQTWVDVARSEALLLVEALADEVGSELGKLAQRNSELERRVRELENQIGKLSADLDAHHAYAAAPLIPLRGRRDAA
jgi:hypothetical protein